MKTCRTGQFSAILLGLGLMLFAAQPVLAHSATSNAWRASLSPGRYRSSSLETDTPAVDGRSPSYQSPVRFDRITTADGLSFPIVRHILQDRQGFLWFATDNGLNRYDGYGFTVYREDPGDPTTIRFDDVRVIYEDSHGTLWVGGGGGLDRFNRATETFTHVDTRGQVFTICEDSAGTLWVGFWHGLYGFDPTTNQIIYSEQPYTGAQADWSTRDQSAVHSILEHPNGDLWIGSGTGLYRRDVSSGAFASYHHDSRDPTSLSSDVVTALHVDRQGALWVGTDVGLDRFDRSAEAFIHFRHDPEDPVSLSGSPVLSILEDGEGTLWLGSMVGLDQFDQAQRRFFHYRHDPDDASSLGADVVLSLFEDRSGILWVGTADGVSKATRREDQFTRYREQGDPSQEGSYSLDVSSLLQEREPAILSDGRILAVAEDAGGALWIGTFNGGLNKLDRRSGRLTVYRHDPGDPTSLRKDGVSALCEDHEGYLWVGTRDGWLGRFQSQTEAFTHGRQLGSEVSEIAEDVSGDLWIATLGEGLYRLSSNRAILTHYAQFWRDPDNWWREGTLSSQIVATVRVDHAGILWVGTVYGGINLWGEVQDRFTHLRHDPADADSLSHDQVLSVFDDPVEGVVWIGTGGGGLNRYDRETRAFASYDQTRGLAGDTVGCIVADDAGYLWIATVKGLSRFDPRTATFRTYDQHDGVGILTAGSAGLGSCLRSQTGELVFGGSDGLYVFRPELIKENPHPPPMAITALKIHNETAYSDLSHRDEIQLPHYDNFLSFEFAALDYTMPDKNQYAYQLEGLDREWVYAGTRRYADYPDLSPGHYVFRVKGSNSDGVWNEVGTAIHITVVPAFWQTWAFRIMISLAVGLLAVGIYRQRVKNIEARSRDLERQVAERTQEIRALSEQAQELAVMEERQRLARDLHDAVSQTLFSASLIAEALPELWRKSHEEGQELLVKLQQLSRGALAEMRALLMELRPASLVEASMQDLLRQLGQAASGREGIPVYVTVEEACGQRGGELPVEVRVGLYRIAQEALNNVAKHAQASQVEVSLRCAAPPQRAHAELCIRDDGVGFNPEAVSQDRLGLGIMRERAESINARLTVTSEPGHGTMVLVLWQADEGETHD